ncbi:MAG: hypothetical protein Q8P84_07445 [Deltaproteobacteria bacterium]|nr:hypothetical protein [Deltaproteobacteria bacterium]
MTLSVPPIFLSPLAASILLPGEPAVLRLAEPQAETAATDLRLFVAGFHRAPLYSPDAGYFKGEDKGTPWLRAHHVFITPRQLRLLGEIQKLSSQQKHRLSLCIERLRERKEIDHLDYGADFLNGAKRLWFEEGIRDFFVGHTTEIISAYALLLDHHKLSKKKGASRFFESLKILLEISDRDLAKKIGISFSQYQKYAKGNVQGLENDLDVMAEALEIEASALKAFFDRLREEERPVLSADAPTKDPAPPARLLPSLLPDLPPANYKLAQLIRTVATEQFRKNFEEFAKYCGIDSQRLTDLARGIVLIPGDGAGRESFEEDFLFYGRLMTFLLGMRVTWAIELDKALRSASLHKNGWLHASRLHWFEKKNRDLEESASALRDFFLEMRCQALLEKGGDAFQRPEQASPRAKLAARFVRWWVFQNAEKPWNAEEYGLSKKDFDRFLKEGMPPADMETVRRLAAKTDRRLLEDWVQWRLEEAQKKFAEGLILNSAGKVGPRRRDAAWKVAEPVFKIWIEFNGGVVDADVQQKSQALFGVPFEVVADLAEGRLPEREWMAEAIAQTVNNPQVLLGWLRYQTL